MKNLQSEKSKSFKLQQKRESNKVKKGNPHDIRGYQKIPFNQQTTPDWKARHKKISNVAMP